MHIIDTGFHRLTPSTTACSVTEPSTCLFATTRILMWAPTSHLESVKLEGLICIFVWVSKVFNESWQRPVWQIRWAPCWERHRELRRRRMLRLKPEAQSRADQHLRQPVAKPCKSLSPFSFLSLPSLCLQLFISRWSIQVNLQSIPHPFIDSAPGWLVVRANGYGKMSARTNIFDEDTRPEPTASS